MSKKTHVIFVDFETAKDMPNQVFYDKGIAVCTLDGHINEEHSFVNSDVFYKCKEDMATCYYVEKLPKYYKAIHDGTRKVINTYEARELVKALMKKYNTNIVCAYNTHFDKTAANNTQKLATNGKYSYFWPKDTVFWDAWLMAKDTICEMASYKKFCAENGFMTKHKTPRPQTKAETVYAFLTNNPNFTEEHQGLDDVRIEIAIMAACIKKHKKMRRVLYSKREDL